MSPSVFRKLIILVHHKTILWRTSFGSFYFFLWPNLMNLLLKMMTEVLKSELNQTVFESFQSHTFFAKKWFKKSLLFRNLKQYFWSSSTRYGFGCSRAHSIWLLLIEFSRNKMYDHLILTIYIPIQMLSVT